MPSFTPIKHSREIPQYAPESAGWQKAQKFESRGRVSEGYTLIAKKECPYFLPYRIARFVVGALATVVSAGCLYYHSATIRKLVTKSSETMRFGVLTPSKKGSHSSKKPTRSKKPKKSASSSASNLTPRSLTPDAKPSFDSPRQTEPQQEIPKPKELPVVLPKQWERVQMTADKLEESCRVLAEGIELSESAREKIRTSLKQIVARKKGDGFTFYASQEAHRVFTLDTEPGLIFKIGKSPDRMLTRHENIVYVNAVRMVFALNRLVIPRVKVFSLRTDENCITLLVEEKLDVHAFENKLQELYLTESRRLDEAVAQLGQLIQYTGISDIEARNCPPLLAKDAEESHKIGLIDLQSLKKPEDGLYGGKYSGRGLIRTISTKYAPEFAKIGAAMTKNFSDKRFKRVLSERKLEVKERERLLEWHKIKHIKTGAEPLAVREEDLDFSAQYSPELAQKIQETALNLIRVINGQMQRSSPNEAVSGRRHVCVYTRQGCFQDLDRTFIDQTRYPEGTVVTDENYKFTYLGCIVNRLLEVKAIYQLLERREKGYFIQS